MEGMRVAAHSKGTIQSMPFHAKHASPSLIGMHPVVAVGSLAVVALLIRLACVLYLHEQPYDDFRDYFVMASGLHDGTGVRDSLGHYAVMNAGYPMFLAAVFLLAGNSVDVATYANAFLGALSVLCVYWVGARILWSRHAAYVAAAAWAIYLPAIRYAEHLGKENLMTPLVLLQLLFTVYYLHSERRALCAAGAGASIGFQALVGSSALAIAPVSVLGIAFAAAGWRTKARDLLVLSLVAGGAVAPWLYRNYDVIGAAVLNNNGGFNLYLGNNENATGMWMSIAQTPLGPHWNALQATRGEAAADRIAAQHAIRYIARHPLQTLALDLRKAWLFWYPPVHERNEDLVPALASAPAEKRLRDVWLIQYCVIAPLALAAVAFWFRRDYRRRAPQLWMLLAGIALYWSVHVVFFVQFRYREPIMPLVVLVAAQGVHFAVLWYRQRAGRVVAADAASGLAAEGTTISRAGKK